MSAFLRYALIVYAVIVTAAFAALVARAGAAAPKTASFSEIDVGRLNIREPDGTIRLALYSKARRPGIIVRNKAQPHPNRTQAGLLFYNDEGTEVGGLVFAGEEKDGVVSSGGSLTFDRFEQDQIVQLLGVEEGGKIQAGLSVFDRPDERFDFEAMEQMRVLEDGPARDAAIEKANFGGAPRAFFGRSPDESSELVLRDAAGAKRLVLSVAADGAASITFLDADGAPVKTIAAAE